MKHRSISIALIFIIIIQTTESFPRIDYVTVHKNGGREENQGSTEGGTLIWIRGTGFVQDEFSTLPTVATRYRVELTNEYATYNCKIHPDEVTDSRLTCYTSAMPSNTYLIRVYENEILIPLDPSTYLDQNYALFISSASKTPLINAITPTTGLPQRMVSLSGDFKTSCYSQDSSECSSEDIPIISRIYIGGQLCNLINSSTNSLYANVTRLNLQCFFESNEVGIFNVTVLITNGYGRSATNSAFYQLSATGQLYTFQTYAVVESISPANGSLEGGTILTIAGQYFSESGRYPLSINVGNEPCIILNMNLTIIQCQTSNMSAVNRSHFHGGRGFHVFSENKFVDVFQDNTSVSMPSINATQTWSADASIHSSFSSNRTVWLIGYLRSPINATYKFQLETNVNSILYLSTDENPNNKVQIASSRSTLSKDISLISNKNYYLLCVGSTRTVGSFDLTIKAKMNEARLTTAGNNGVKERQRITVGSPITNERQRIIYAPFSIIDGTPEIQDVLVTNNLFQLGFRGVFTNYLDGSPDPQVVQLALNNLPTIYPFEITVELVQSSYRITFPAVMGDVPLLTIISTDYSSPQYAIEIQQGVSSGTHLAFDLDGAVTNYLDFWGETITTGMLRKEINALFSIRCPPSLNNQEADSSIVYVEEFERNDTYNENILLSDVAFCNRGAYSANNPVRLVVGNSQPAEYICFAYKLENNAALTLDFYVESDEDESTRTTESIPMSNYVISDNRWHYKCIQLSTMLEIYNYNYFLVYSFLIIDVSVHNNPANIWIDTVTLRNSLPLGYEDETTIGFLDQSSANTCAFPFWHNNHQYYKCLLDENNLPICRTSANQTAYCQSSSIEGVRRLFPKYQLLNNEYLLTHVQANRSIDISFRYTDCQSPTLIKPVPSNLANVTSITTASKPIGGYYDIIFNNQLYTSIPGKISASQLTDLLQSFGTFGYVTVTREGECGRYAYTIDWLAKGDQPTIEIVNRTNMIPSGAPINVTTVREGTDGNSFYNLPTDLMRTYHTKPQVEVVVGGYSSYCLQEKNNCQFQFVAQQTPKITSIQQNELNLTIDGDGFSSTLELNIVLIGEQGSCYVVTASSNRLICIISNAPAGIHNVRVNVIEKGFASSNQSLQVTVPLQITSFSPSTGAIGGGYLMNINGIGFSSNSSITIGERLCTNIQFNNYSSLSCIVPSSLTSSMNQAIVSIADGRISVNSLSVFTYNSTNTPIVLSIEPSVVHLSDEILNISGTGFPNDNSIVVFIGTKSATVLSVSTTQIQIVLPKFSPGQYPVQVETSLGFAQSNVYVNYEFYVERISPQIGSLYGGSDVYVYGEGFDSLTKINFYDQNRANVYPCDVEQVLSNRIRCRTQSLSNQIIINANGTHPSYNGPGFAWSPLRVSVEQGTNVTWTWYSSELLPDRFYRVHQVADAYSTEPLVNGFDSGSATLIGSFSYVFRELGTYYYFTPAINDRDSATMRGVIDVLPMKSRELQVEVTRKDISAQSCVFPFTYNSIAYTDCTSINDTRSWCSPTSFYSGQRLYCTSRNTNSSSNTTCPSNVINSTVCNQSMPLSSTAFLPTLCTTGSIISISPLNGSAGTVLTITGNGFNGNVCEYEVMIGSSYRCPITSKTLTQITCQITNGSMLDASQTEIVRVVRNGQGYLNSIVESRFQFIPSIYSVSPRQGSTEGGTQVTIQGDGFILDKTHLYIGSNNNNYTSLATITYSQIVFTTERMTSNLDYNQPVYVFFPQSRILSRCATQSCTFNWLTTITPDLSSVSPLSIDAATNITLTGTNLIDSNAINRTHIIINDNSCDIIEMINETITCTLNNIEGGVHLIQGLIDGIGYMGPSSIMITVVSVVLNSTPEVSSIHGGSILTITGFGFSRNVNNIRVMIGTEQCVIIQSTTSEIQCTIPPQNQTDELMPIRVSVNNSVLSPSSFFVNYSNAYTPVVDSIDVVVTNGSSVVLRINGNRFDTRNNTNVKVGNLPCTIRTVSLTSITCEVSTNLGAGYHSVVVQVNNMGNSNSNITYLQNLVVSSISPQQGSFGGGLLVNIYGEGLNTDHVNVTICNRTCSSLTILSNNQLTCLTPAVSSSEVNSSCNVIVSVDNMSQNTIFTYANNLTATISSVSPRRGGTGGGTLLTIVGTQFPNSANQITVKVDNVICSIQTINSTTIRCRTGRYTGRYVDALVTVLINGSGYAIGTFQFQYVNLWSSRWTWGGDDPPEADTVVSITNGVTIFLDVSPPSLKALVLDNATLIFEDLRDVELTAEYIVITNGSHLQVGTETNPFQHRAVITLNGYPIATELPIFGAKVLALRDGILDLHGKSTIQTWTKLARTELNGSFTITLLNPVDWPINSEIIIATTGDQWSQRESEVRRIANISSDGLTLTLNETLQYTHLGETRQVNITSVEIRAEVGLLSHNVIFQGSLTRMNSETIEQCSEGSVPDEHGTQKCSLSRYGDEFGSDQFGATIMISRDPIHTDDLQRTIVRLSNVEITNVGQAFRLNRHPINFYRNDNMNMSYVKSCSIHSTFNRAINIEASDYLTIENNVVYNIMSGAMFLADGIEIGNIFRGNLVVYVRATSNLESEYFTPAAFWLTNPNNTVEHNAIAGCTHYGYLYQLLDAPTGLSIYNNANYRPYKQPLGRFYNNSVHSTGLFGVLITPRYTPTVSGTENDQQIKTAVFEGLTAWKNNVGMESIMSYVIQIKNALLFDNSYTGISNFAINKDGELNPPYLQSTFYNIENGSAIINSIIIGNLNDTADVITPLRTGLTVIYDRGLLVHNVTFINFLSNQIPAIYGPTSDDFREYQWRGWTTKFSQMSFINVGLRGRFQSQYESLYEDEDGTLSGQNETMAIMPQYGLISSPLSCSSSIYFAQAIQCTTSAGSWVRVWIKQHVTAYTDFSWSQLQISNELHYNTTALHIDPNGYIMTLQVNKTYQFTLSDYPDWYQLYYSLFVYDFAPNDYLIIQHTMNRRLYGDFSHRSSTPLSAVNNSHGDWYYDENTMLFSYIIKNSMNTTAKADIQFDFANINTCPYCQDCGCPTTTTTTATTATTTTATTTTTTSATTTTTTSATTVTTTSATTTTTTSQTTMTTRSPCDPTTPQYWSMDSSWTDPQDYPNWNRSKPGEYQNIRISSCTWMIIDCPLPRIRSLRIDGTLQFQEGLNHRIYVDSISITTDGKLVAGNTNQPFTGTVEIILTNNLPINISLPSYFPNVEQKTIVVIGALDLHGSYHDITWTRLNRTAVAGSNLLTLSTSVDWQVDDEIIVTTTDASITHTERHRIIEIVNSTTIRLANTLAYTHLVTEQRFSSRNQQIRVAAAVGLLTHNIRVKSEYPSTSLAGFQILVTRSLLNTNIKGTARLTNVQFIGFGRFNDSRTADKNAGIYMDTLGDSSGITYIDKCSFDGGYNGAIGMVYTHSIVITNNVFYNTYRTALVLTGKYHLLINNLVSTIYWSGTAKPALASYNFNCDGAITSHNALQITMTNNLVAGIERIAYRIQGNGCPLTNPVPWSNNIYANNEAHSAMAGVSIWPSDRGFRADRECVYINGFTVYKGWYYGFYINTARNITIDSCATIDSEVGIFTFVIGPSPLTHMVLRSRVQIQNSIIIGSLPASDCLDKTDTKSLNIQKSELAKPTVAIISTENKAVRGRVGIVFPTFSPKNGMPDKPWTGVSNYPCLDGTMFITDTTIAFFNDKCGRQDVALQVSQSNDDGQFPVITNSIFRFNVSDSNIVFNGLPNLNPQSCGDIDCDGLKRNLIIDTDGTLFGLRTSVFSRSEALWGTLGRVGDTKLPEILKTYSNGEKKNTTALYPYRGISRNSCVLQPRWGMYRCNYKTEYRMMIIESMDSTTEKQKISPVAILSDDGYLDLLNNPQDHSVTTTIQSSTRISTFMSIIQSNQTYFIYFTGYLSNHTRFRLINADESIQCILAVYFNSLQQIDVYANSQYIFPTNRDWRYSTLILKDEKNTVNMSSSSGDNYFDRKERYLYFKIDGNTIIDVKIAPLFILTFGLPPMEVDEIYRDDIATRLALIFNFDQSKIRRVKIVPVSNSSESRRRRNIEPTFLTLEIRDEPRRVSTGSDGVRGEVLINTASQIINSFQSGELAVVWKEANLTNGSIPTSLTVQEPFNHTNASLSIINRTELRTAPAQCREQSPCVIQPVLFAYDADGNIIRKLGSNDQPWQVKATVVGQPNMTIVGDTADYVDGQTRFTLFSLPNLGSYQVQFSFMQPNGVKSSFFQNANLTVESIPITVTNAIIAGEQVNNIYVVNVSEKFDITIIPVDKQTRLPLGKVRWGNWTWTANVTLRNLPKYNRPGKLIRTSSIAPVIDPVAKTITIRDLKINSTGMFMIDIRLVSTNNEHVISLSSNGILVKTASTDEGVEFLSDINDFSSNITFAGDFDALDASNQLEERRAMIYNYLLTIGMPMISDVVLIKGSVVALFQVDTLIPSGISQAVTTLLADPSAIPDLSVSTVNINSRTYSNPSSNTSPSSNDSANNTALIVGVVIGLIAVSIIVFIGVYAYRKRRGFRICPTPCMEDSDLNFSSDNNANRQSIYETEQEQVVRPPVWFPTIFPPPPSTPTPVLKRRHPIMLPPIEMKLTDIQECSTKGNMDKVLNEMTDNSLD